MDFVILRVWETRSLFVNRHERTAETTSDLRFSRVARVRLLEHVRRTSTASMEEIAAVDAKETPLPTADTQVNDLMCAVHDHVADACHTRVVQMMMVIKCYKMCTTTRSVFAPAA